MPVPTLPHPVNVTIQVRRSDLTKMDDDFQEPIGKVVRDSEIILPGQIYWQNQVFEAAKTGVQDRMTGYILFRWKDLTAQSITLKVGDKITKIGNIENMPAGGPPFYIYRFEYRGHYPKLGATLVKAWFNSKQPVK